jgi:hypothetical protein
VEDGGHIPERFQVLTLPCSNSCLPWCDVTMMTSPWCDGSYYTLISLQQNFGLNSSFI